MDLMATWTAIANWTGWRRKMLISGLLLMVYFGSFACFVLSGHRDYWNMGYGYRYLPDTANQNVERALSVFFYPAFSVCVLVGIDLAYLHEPFGSGVGGQDGKHPVNRNT